MFSELYFLFDVLNQEETLKAKSKKIGTEKYFLFEIQRKSLVLCQNF